MAVLVWRGGRRNGHKGTSQSDKIFHDLIGMVITWVYTTVKIHQTVHLKSMRFMVYKLHFNINIFFKKNQTLFKCFCLLPHWKSSYKILSKTKNTELFIYGVIRFRDLVRLDKVWLWKESP